MPIALVHMVTSLCNCRCRTCNLWKRSADYKNDLKKEEVFQMIDNAKKAGVIGYLAWGGEPLMRKDLPELLKYAKGKGLLTCIITNGFFLSERLKEIMPFTNYIAVSLDSFDDLHDKIRGVDGLFCRVMKGIELCKKNGMKVRINCVLSTLNLDKVEGMLELSKRLDVPISFVPMQSLDDYIVNDNYNKNLIPSRKQVKEAFLKITAAKKSGYKIGSSLQYLRNMTESRNYTCQMSRVFANVDHDGDIFTCMGKKWGNVKNINLKELFDSKEYVDFCKGAEKCHKCDLSCAIESSVGYSLDPSFFMDMGNNLF
jgi:MoaA/NifB/PqqE/SkfB family radical SAM enzyme